MPVVNGLEREYRGELGVVYVSLDEADGREIARGYGVIGTPTFLLLDGQGDQVQVLRGSIPVQIIEQAVEDLVKQQGAD